ncbi:putative AP2 protein [Hordeum vulgare]|nr:putative AP2 protein [Hordeum vulgare]
MRLPTQPRASPSSRSRLFLYLSLATPSAAMPPRRRSSSGYRGVCERPFGTYYVEIRSGDVRLGLGTFETVHEAARAYNLCVFIYTTTIYMRVGQVLGVRAPHAR